MYFLTTIVGKCAYAYVYEYIGRVLQSYHLYATIVEHF